MSAEKQLERSLKQHQFQLVRQAKHKVYKRDDGRILVVSLTPSDFRWADNALKDLSRVLAEPPRSEMLSKIELDKREAAIVLERQNKTKVQNGGANRKTKGTGFMYIDKTVSPLTPEQQEQSRLASERAKKREQCASLVRQFRNAMVQSVLVLGREQMQRDIAQVSAEDFEAAWRAQHSKLLATAQRLPQKFSELKEQYPDIEDGAETLKESFRQHWAERGRTIVNEYVREYKTLAQELAQYIVPSGDGIEIPTIDENELNWLPYDTGEWRAAQYYRMWKQLCEKESPANLVRVTVVADATEAA